MSACLSITLLVGVLGINFFQSFEASVPRQFVRSGDPVKGLVNVSGTLLVESDLSGAGTSSTNPINDKGQVDVGKVKNAGLYFVKLVTASNKSVVLAIVVIQNNQGFIVESVVIDKSNSISTLANSDLILNKLALNIVKNNYALAKLAAKKVIKEWVAKHIVESSATITICVLPVPGAQGICVARIGDHLIDLGFEYLEALIDECKELTDSEKSRLRAWMQTGKSVIDLAKIVRADLKIEKLIEAASAGVNLAEYIVKDRKGNDMAVSVIGNNFIGVIDKAAVTIKIVTK